MGITIPPAVLALGTDQAVDAFISGIVMAHDYIVGDNPYRESVDKMFEKVDEYAPHVIKGIEMGKDALKQGVEEVLSQFPTAGMGVKTVTMPMKDFKAEHKHLLDLLKNPTVQKLQAEYKKQSAEMKKETKGGAMPEQLDLLGMSEVDYLKKAKAKAKKAGYDPKKLSLCSDGVHKLDYDGVKFGRVGYGDHIIYSFLEKKGEVERGTASKKRKVFRKSHGAMKDSGKLSANQLAIHLLW